MADDATGPEPAPDPTDGPPPGARAAPPPANPEVRFTANYAGLPARLTYARYPFLFGEALALGWIAFLVPRFIGVEGLELGIFSLFLTAISLSFRFGFLLDEHREAILQQRQRPFRAHVVTGASLVSLFLGVCAAYASFVGLLSSSSIDVVFGFVPQITGKHSGTFLRGRFAPFWPLFTHNARVMAATVLVCLLYRSYGAVLVLGWNACIWIVTLGMLTRRTVEASDKAPWAVTGISTVAVLPHLVLELTGYVVAVLAGIFISKAVTRYDWGDKRFLSILVSSALLILSALATLALAAFVESRVPALVLPLLR
jgi:hypothetical protein